MNSCVPRQRRADRRAQALAETDRHRVELRGPCLRRNAGGDDGVPQTGAVQMQDQSVRMRPGADGLDLLKRDRLRRRHGCACSPGRRGAVRTR